MLQELSINNLALIDKARIQFGQGLNILTGETGAGKTVVVGAVNLLLGGRADASLIRSGSAKAEVQGMFVIPHGLKASDEKLSDILEDDDQLIIRRVISTDGKNKCYINDHMVTVATLSEIGRRLVDLHGQHEHQSLFKTSSHVDFLDKYGGKKLLELRSAFREKSEALRRLKDELGQLRGAEREMLGKKDLLQFQVGEIERAALAPGEDDELMRERDILRNAEKLYCSVAKAANALSESDETAPGTELVARAVDELRVVASIDPELDGLIERLNGILIELEDCSQSIRDYGSTLDFPPGRLQEIEDRLAVLSLLKRKYGATIEDILAYMDTASEELLLCDTSGERMEKLEVAIKETEKELAGIAVQQSEARASTGKNFVKEVMRELADLNMPNARFEVLFSREQDSDGLLVEDKRTKLYANGIDKIEFMVSANKGEPAKPLTKIASGGEISRVMLALKIILADADEVPTLIFDEIDVGIGGTTAMAVGQKMSILGLRHQVFSVTHLPQIASFADKHFSVVKLEVGERTNTEIVELLSGDRVSEMARLLSGNVSSDVSLKHAEELITEAQKNKHGLIDGRVN
ncbi:MAG: DNA repair protein RecN [Candidatus Aquicultor sp.]